jgi:hypothetical protein
VHCVIGLCDRPADTLDRILAVLKEDEPGETMHVVMFEATLRHDAADTTTAATAAASTSTSSGVTPDTLVPQYARLPTRDAHLIDRDAKAANATTTTPPPPPTTAAVPTAARTSAAARLADDEEVDPPPPPIRDSFFASGAASD